ncbi:conserved hypothetical protein [Histoplasma capsulatum var. duboisii H88]|uniref:Uncharacterized protein n=1 Tax=Ajellomyces capsulatus (strain H88) TaxID=544711 RepID=F0UU43_AJEC8|nr:conserved hypothetical protein [Histoplasma capsulatum var. duboisii H88]QSS57746.1 hypothetical protein I7I53_12027 [Histoplasma capsulatum var. duboisii H88]
MGSGGAGHKFGFSRHHGPPSASNFEEDEPLLFTMSDFGIARGSLDGGARASVGGADSSGPGTGTSGSRRGSGRRGASSSGGYHPWQ